MTAGPADINILIVYAQENIGFIEELELHLKILKRQGLVNNWTTREIIPGQPLGDRAAPELEHTDIILLIISPAFLKSDYLKTNEAKKTLDLQRDFYVDVIPLILEDCAWEQTVLSDLMPLPESGKPVLSSRWLSMDEAFVNIDKTLKQLIKRRREKKEAENFIIKKKAAENRETLLREIAVHGEFIPIESPNKAVFTGDNKDKHPG